MRTAAAGRVVAVLGLLALSACGSSGGPAGGAAGAGGGAAGAGSAGRGGAAGNGAAGTSGAAGAAGSAGGGSGAGAAGTSGAAGAAGSGGAAGNAGVGAAGVGGAGGRGGGAGTPAGGTSGGAGGAAGAAGLVLEYATSSATMTSFTLHLTVNGPLTPTVNAIKLRYYFTDDSGNGTVAPVIDQALWTIASPSTMYDLLRTGTGCSVVSAIRTIPTTSYADINCALSSPVNVGDTLDFMIRFNTTLQNPANDYSYMATGGALVPNDHMLVTVNGVVVWGLAPN